MRKRSQLYILLTITALIVAVGLPQAQAQEIKEKAPPKILLKNINIFDGKKDSIATGYDVLVEGKLVKKIGKGLNVQSATVIEGGGRTLMPGLIEGYTLTLPRLSFFHFPLCNNSTSTPQRLLGCTKLYL